MEWFNVEKMDTPSLPHDKPVTYLGGYVIEKEHAMLYRLCKVKSQIDIYAFQDHFIASQCIHGGMGHCPTNSCFEYRLTLTDEAKKVVDALLKAPFTCNVKREVGKGGQPLYVCTTIHQASAPTMLPTTTMLPTMLPNRSGSATTAWAWKWVVGVSTTSGIVEVREGTTIPFNCGPLKPLWERAVECWVKKLAELKPSDLHPNVVMTNMLQCWYIDVEILPVYSIYGGSWK